MENIYLSIAFVLVMAVLLVGFLISQLDNIKLRGELAKAEINIRFLKEILIIRDWYANSLKIYALLLKNGYGQNFINSSGFQEMLIREFELFDKIKSFNPEIELDQEMMRRREIYMSLMIPRNNLPS